ncbi:MAG: 30S ribosomal protein S2 [Alphaproteobacteria bacterium]|nr:30S ribosomal protein S2 [Alphaproteobacteria bacterium]MBQ3117759.1 30S ribosomal protein S2 [Alphaproteobacteria bacterium]MBQ6855005.1 30S ribosomal protein S2 [Alphaproteobacteria bacterium]MBQ8557432.1 30S ribosomal protein S2 [Alphaproteobacteria bacterium]
MTLPTITIRQLMENGVHFGHNARRWNPKMGQYIYGTRDGVHIMDLTQTQPMLARALEAVREVAAKGGKVLFVGTKIQAQEPIAAAANRCGQYYVNHRWLGGMLTNWKTISSSIKRLKEIDAKTEKGELQGLTKKEKLNIAREREKLFASLGGIQDMNGRPDLIFVIDVPKEELAINEAKKLGIPVVAICDSNANPDGIAYPIPGNDDALRAINLYCDLISGAVLDGMQAELKAAGVDLGAIAEPMTEEVVAETAQA